MVANAFDYTGFSDEEAARLKEIAALLESLRPVDSKSIFEMGRLLSEAKEICDRKEDREQN